MKNINYIILLLFALVSCKDYLDVVPDDQETLDLAFTNQYNAEKFLYGCYGYLPQNSNPFTDPAINGGDEIWLPEILASEESGAALARGFQNVTSPHFNYWGDGNNLYKGIRLCNIFIANVDNVLEMPEYLKKQWKAEAIFLKAYFHFYLVRMYGPIVINDKAVEVSAVTEEVQAERNTLEECFQFIIKNLDESIKDLPVTLINKSEDLGRITKPIAASIKARVLMHYASPLFNGNTVYSGFRNAQGAPLIPIVYDASKWNLAAKACKEAIDICHGAGIALIQKDDFFDRHPEFTKNDTTLIAATLRNRVTEKWNNEIIWGTTFDTYEIQRRSMPRLYSYKINTVQSRQGVTLRVVEQYYSENGVPINEDPSYDFANRYNKRTAVDTEKQIIEPGQETASLNYNRELRFYADLAFDRGAWYGNGKYDENDPWYIHSRKGEFASIFDIRDYSVTGYWPKKLINLETFVENGNSFKQTRYTFPVIRLADLYLYYAEALNETKESPDALVYQYIDLVRKRANLKGVVQSWKEHSIYPNTPSTKVGMRSIIHQERMIEMAFEGNRYWDLRRWKRLEFFMNKPIKGWNVLSENAEDYYNIRTIFNPNFSQRDYLWPIAQGEIINNPSIIQNIGW